MDSFTAALSRLDPASRALLDLSLRRGMRPEEIGDLLGTDPESVIVAREGALEQLASELGMEDVSELDDVRARLAELPPEAWTGQTAPDAAPQGEKAAAEEAEPETRPEPRPAREPKRRSRLPLLLALLAIAAVVLVIVLASSGGDDQQTASNPPAQQPKQKKPKSKSKSAPASPKPGPTVQLTPLSDAHGASGTATLTDGGRRLTVKASGLPSGAYQVWLYDSVIETKSLTKVQGTKIDVDVKLPSDASHYRYVDISLEPPDGNPNHSGQSVLRVPLAKLSS